jgi:hypothetical protein
LGQVAVVLGTLDAHLLRIPAIADSDSILMAGSVPR